MRAGAAPEPGTDVLALIEQQLAAARQAEAEAHPDREAEALRAIETLAAGLRWDLTTETTAQQSVHGDRIATVLDAVWSAPGGGRAA
jgi:hypothetical protein